MRKTSDTMHTPKFNTLAPLSAAAHRLTLGAMVAATLALGACASLGNSNPEAQVTQRANERWKHMVAREFDKAYAYSTPAFRDVVTPESYRGRFGPAVKWVGAEVVRVNCPEPAKCVAVVRLDFSPLLGRASGQTYNTHFDETWLLENGQWSIFQNIQGE